LKNKNGNHFVAILKLFTDRGKIEVKEVNNIRSVYPKDRIEEIINWFKSGNKLTLWLDKAKALNFVFDQSTYGIVEENKEGLLINIIKNF
jgi:hypothetical protein